jgi:transposase InsO family protein
MPNECWQADFTHYRLATGADTEILTWLDDHARYALTVTAHERVTGPIVLTAFQTAYTAHGIPASVRISHPAPQREASPHRRRPHPRGNRVLLIVEGLDIRVINATTGENLRELTLDPTRDCQPTGRPKGPTRPA